MQNREMLARLFNFRSSDLEEEFVGCLKAQNLITLIVEIFSENL